MKLTVELIYECRTRAGSWNRHQLEKLGVPWPPRHGWIERIVGKEISREEFEEIKTLGTIPARTRRMAEKGKWIQSDQNPNKIGQLVGLIKMLIADYDHPWPNEDADTREHRERRLSQMRDAIKRTDSDASVQLFGH